jgi:hypothetical protein
LDAPRNASVQVPTDYGIPRKSIDEATRNLEATLVFPGR